MTCASLGTFTELAAPTAVIFPPCMTMVPFSITPWLTVRILPLLRAMGLSCAIADPIKKRIVIPSEARNLHFAES
jgi:hypothetical protein